MFLKCAHIHFNSHIFHASIASYCIICSVLEWTVLFEILTSTRRETHTHSKRMNNFKYLLFQKNIRNKKQNIYWVIIRKVFCFLSCNNRIVNTSIYNIFQKMRRTECFTKYLISVEGNALNEYWKWMHAHHMGCSVFNINSILVLETS